MTDHIADFTDWLRQIGLAPLRANAIIADDKPRRFSVEGDRGSQTSVTYQLAVKNDFAFGYARSMRESRTFKYPPANAERKKQSFTAEERAAFRKQQLERRAAVIAEREQTQAKVAEFARFLWSIAAPGDRLHKYAVKKNMAVDGLKTMHATHSYQIGGWIAKQGQDFQLLYEKFQISGNELIVPLWDQDSKIVNLQRITARGDKMFLPGGKIHGCFHAIGRRVSMVDQPFIFCEGRATGWALWRILKQPVVCAMNSGNLEPVLLGFRRKYIYSRFLIASDFDCWTMKGDVRSRLFKGEDLRAIPGDDPRWVQWREADYLYEPGFDCACVAGKRAHAQIVLPSRELMTHPEKPTDFDDVARLLGDDAVAAKFKPYL